MRSRALAEQPDGRDLGQRRRVRLACGQRQRRHRMRLLGLDGQRFAAGREHREVGARGDQRPDPRCGVGQVLAVVDDQQQLLDGQKALDRVRHRLARERDDRQRAHDRPRYVLGAADRRQRHEAGAVGEVGFDGHGRLRLPAVSCRRRRAR